MSEGWRCWTSLTEDVLDRVIAAVECLKRLRRDGPSIRILNRHWCRCVSKRVKEIRPHPSRTLCGEDVEALSKFPNAHTVDIDPFLQIGSVSLDELVQALAAMPSLTRLEATRNLCEAFLKEANAAALSGVKQMELRQASGYCPDRLSNALARHPGRFSLEEIHFDGGLCLLSDLLDAGPGFKRLHIRLLDSIDAEDIHKLNRLESFSVGYPGLPVETLSSVKTLVCLTLLVYPNDIGTVTALENLQTLVLYVEFESWDETFNGVVDLTAFENLRRLETLAIRCNDDSDMWTLNLEAPLENVKRFGLDMCEFRGTQLRDHLPKATVFKLSSLCRVQETEAFFQFLRNVEALQLPEELDDSNDQPVDISWSHDQFPKLRALWTRVFGIENDQARTLFSLTRLERLALQLVLPPYNDRDAGVLSWIEGINRLSCLRELDFAGFDGIQSRLSDAFLSNLEVLNLYRDSIWSWNTEDDLKKAYERAPHLVTDKGNPERVRRTNAWYETD